MKKDNANFSPAGKKTSVRWFIVFMLFVVTSINYADRATLSIAGDAVQQDLGLDSVAMGYVFSAFGWAYVIAQLPGGWLLDRFGSKTIIALSIFFGHSLRCCKARLDFFPLGLLLSCCLHCVFWWGFLKRRHFLGTAEWLPHGSQAPSAARLQPSLIQLNTSLSLFFLL